MTESLRTSEKTEPRGSMLIDRLVPDYDATRIEHLVIDADPPTTWRALKELDFLQVRTPLLSAAFWVRGLPERISHRLRGTPLPPPPPRVTLTGAGEGLEGWASLGEDPEREIVIGAIGVFWTPQIKWEDVRPEDFESFDAPGFGKIAADFSLRPYGEARTLLTYEARTRLTDPDSRRRFRRYWMLVSPFVGHIMRATLRTVGENATR